MSPIVGITFGAFDLCHAGHILLFKDCKRLCDYLIVGLQFDPSIERKDKNTPVQSFYERYVQLQGVKYVDEIIPYRYEEEIIQILQTVNVHIRFFGNDYIGKDFTGKEVCDKKLISKHYVNRDHGFSSSELRKRIESINHR